MPTPTHVAHDVVNATLATAQDYIKSAKKSPGVIKWTVEKLEGPVCTVLKSKLVQTATKVGDGALTYADGTLDRAMNTNAYKTTSRVVKTTYTTRIVPATTAVTKPVINAYTGALELADKSVEWALPEADAKLAKEDKALPKSVVGLSRKITRRSVRKVAATRKMVVATAAYTLENAKPAKIKANTVIVYQKSLVGADKLIDTYLPDKDGLKGSTPVLLVKKVAKRGTTYTIAVIKKIATAVKNSPTTFKKSAALACKKVTEHAMKLKNMKLKLKLLTVEDIKKTLGPYIKSTDTMLLKYRYTAAVRNLVVSKLGPVVQPMLTKFLGKEEKPSIMPAIKPAATRSAPPPTRSAPPPSLPAAEPVPAPQPPKAEEKVAKFEEEEEEDSREM